MDAPDHIAGGPKVHFDLAGYDILFWNPEELDQAREELTKRIRRRISVISTPSMSGSPLNKEWTEAQRALSLPHLQSLSYTGGIEIRHSLDDRQLNFPQSQLLEAARNAQINTFGWPIGIVLETNEINPHPRTDGVFEEISIKKHPSTFGHTSSYDYWAFRRNGDYYLLKSYYEDESIPPSGQQKLFFNTRIVRVTEALLHCARLYNILKLDPTSIVQITIHHSGLKGRQLGASTNLRDLNTIRTCEEEEIETTISTKLMEIETNLIPLVKEIIQPLLILFDFFELHTSVYEDIINSFVAGRVN